jgi:hypothetical protein
MWHVWARGETHTGFWWGNLREIDHLEEVGVEVRIILNQIFKKWAGGMDWIDLAQDMDRWTAFVTAAMNLQLHKIRRIF